MVKRLVLLTLFLLAALAFSSPAGARLVPISWGFPVMIQSGSTTGLQASTAMASDLESANIGFPGFGGLFAGAFPSIAQTGAQSAAQTNLGFANQNQNMIFAYPYISIGGAPVPGMGLL